MRKAWPLREDKHAFFYPPGGPSILLACVECCISGRTQVGTHSVFPHILHDIDLSWIETKFNSDLENIRGNKYRYVSDSLMSEQSDDRSF